MKLDIKEAFEKLVQVVETTMGTVKNDTNEKCKTMADTVLKLYGKISKLQTRSKVLKL